MFGGLFRCGGGLLSSRHDVAGLVVSEDTRVHQGSFSVVWRCRALSGRGPAGEAPPEYVALKRTAGGDEVGVAAARNEVEVLGRLAEARGPGAEFIVGYLGHSEAPGPATGCRGDVLALLEWCEGGALLDSIRGEQEPAWPPPAPEARERLAVRVLREASRALRFLHARHGLVHYDLSPDNILLCADGSTRLCDFGSASTRQWPGLGAGSPPAVVQEVVLFSHGLPSAACRPPELADPASERRPVTGKVDVFQLGRCVSRLLFAGHERPSDQEAPEDAGAHYSAGLLETLAALLRRDPRHRPRPEELCDTGLLLAAGAPAADAEEALREFSPAELADYDGDVLPKIYISFCGRVYDVSSRPDMYGRSPPGPYHLFGGRECSRALCTMSMDPDDVGRDDLEDLEALIKKLPASMSTEEVRTAVATAKREWQERMDTTYRVVGALRGGGSSPSAPRVLGGLRGHHGAAAGPAASLPAAPESAAPGPLELICQRPRALLQRRFLSSEECRRLIDMTLGRQRCGSVFEKKARSPLEVSDPRWDPEQRAFLERIEARLAAIMGGPVHADEDALVGTLTPPGGEESIADHLGLHVDTNAAPWRFCTAIIYLSSVQRGGETVFPVALRPGAARGEEAPGLAAAAQELLDLGVDHTDKAKVGQGGPAAAAAAQRLLAAARRTDAGVRVAPEEGTVCVFWTRLDDGEVDCHSWHAGAPVPKGDNWKWTLQKFKEVPMSVRSSSAALADFVRGTRHLATAAVAGEAAGSPDG